MPEVTALCAGVLVKAAGGHITLELLTKPQGNLRFRRVLDAETSPCEEGIDRRGYFPAVFVFMEDWTMVVSSKRSWELRLIYGCTTRFTFCWKSLCFVVVEAVDPFVSPA